MEINNIQNMFRQYATAQGTDKTSKNGMQGNTARGEATGRSLQIDAFDFKLNVQHFSTKEVSGQGKYFKTFSLYELNISISTRQTETNEEPAATATDATAQEFDPDGYWGIAQTSDRLAEFVITGGGEDLTRLRQGREGILRGLQEAEKAWGAKLPEISYKTIEAALGKIDDRIKELGGSVIDATA